MKIKLTPVVVLVVLAGLSACYLDQIPITEHVARASTYRVIAKAHDGSERSGDAWVVDPHHMITTSAICKAGNIAALVDGVKIHASEYHNERLCILSLDDARLGPPMILARTWHRRSSHFTTEGSPLWSKWGVVGVVLELDLHGRVTSSAGLSELERFARERDLNFEIAIPLSDLDLDLACQQNAKATGQCTP